jgi:hypothetical protein
VGNIREKRSTMTIWIGIEEGNPRKGAREMFKHEDTETVEAKKLEGLSWQAPKVGRVVVCSC